MLRAPECTLKTTSNYHLVHLGDLPKHKLDISSCSNKIPSNVFKDLQDKSPTP